MDFSSFINALAAQGPLGIVLVITGWVAWRKDQELKAEREARISDAKSYTELALKLQAQVIDAVNKLADILDDMKRFMRSRSTETNVD